MATNEVNFQDILNKSLGIPTPNDDSVPQISKRRYSNILKANIINDNRQINKSIGKFSPKLQPKLHKMAFKMRKDYRTPNAKNPTAHYVCNPRKVATDARKPDSWLLERYNRAEIYNHKEVNEYQPKGYNMEMENEIKDRITTTQDLKHIDTVRKYRSNYVAQAKKMETNIKQDVEANRFDEFMRKAPLEYNKVHHIPNPTNSLNQIGMPSPNKNTVKHSKHTNKVVRIHPVSIEHKTVSNPNIIQGHLHHGPTI